MYSTPLKITAVIDNDEPAIWVCETLAQLSEQPSLDLQCIVLSDNLDDTHLARQQHEAQMAQARVENKFGHRLGKLILYGYMDRPQFTTRPLNAAALPEHLQAKTHALHGDKPPSMPLPASTDIILLLGKAQLNELSQLPKPTIATWCAQHQHMAMHIEKAMLNRAPLLWIHLWQKTPKASDAATQTSQPWERVTSHALPQQSYFASDQINSAFCCLPNLFSSRLNWLAHGVKSIDQVETEFLRKGESLPKHHDDKPLNGIGYFVKVLRLLVKFYKERINNLLTIDQWQLAYKIRSPEQSPDNLTLSDFQAITPPADKLWADPFIYAHEQKLHVFFEEMAIDGNKAHLSTAQLDENGLCSEVKTVLTEDQHLSYPYVFSYDNAIYMIPETGGRQTISAYKAVNFPTQWERSFDIMTDVNAADSTLFHYDGYWWLFTNCVTGLSIGERDLLHIFYATDWQTGPWYEHPLNPVVTGVDKARMGGAIFVRDGALHRPSQYGAYRYGYGVNLSRIDVLSTTDYQETLINRLAPESEDTQWRGVHTSVHLESLTVIDRLCRIKRKR